jgi:hypothetical protein
MINFSTKLLDSKQNPQAASICAKSLAANSHKLAAATSQSAFAATLARMTVDPNSSLVNSSAPSAAPSASASQIPVTGQNPAAALTGWNALIPPTQTAASTASPASADSMKHWYASSPADDAYWAKQPPAVQQLREIENSSQRQQVASQLASEGYTIDVPIMVWGWDAGITTQLRESDGYTWVPSAEQQPVSEAPGINSPGFTPYNPSNPPPGSISVG